MFMMLTMVPKLTHRLRHKQTGQSMTEFALVLPILLLLLFGIMDFSRMLFFYVQISNGSREAARFGSLTGFEGTPGWTQPQYLDCAAIRNKAIETLGIGMGITASDISIQYDGGGTAVYGFTCDDHPQAIQLRAGDRVRVTINTRFKFVTPVLSSLPEVPFSFTSARSILKGGGMVGGGVQ